MSNVLRYPGKIDGRGIGQTPVDVLDSLIYTFKYFYRVRESSVPVWGAETPYVAGTQLHFANNTGNTLTFYIEFITRRYRQDGTEALPEERRQEVFYVTSTTTLSLSAPTVDPGGPIATGAFTVTVNVVSVLGPPVTYNVTGTFQLLDGVTVVFSGALTFTQITPGVWKSANVDLYTYAPPPTSRDLKVVVQVTPTSGYANSPTTNATFPGYWISTVSPDLGDTYRELMSNFQSYWMNMDRLPGVRHSVKPVGGDVAPSDLYIVSFEPEAEPTPFVSVGTEVIGDSPTGGWYYDTYSDAGWLLFNRVNTDAITGVKLSFKFVQSNYSNSGYIILTHQTTYMSYSVDISTLVPGTDYTFDLLGDIADMSGDWIIQIYDYDYSGMIQFQNISVTFMGA